MKRFSILLLSASLIFAIASKAPADSVATQQTRQDQSFSTAKPTHDDPDKNARTCFACHRAHGKRSAPMMRAPSDKLCLICHGPFNETPEDKATDVYSSLRKRSRHPVTETAQYHRANETLPETSPIKPRHVSCYDCHEPHTVRNDKKMGRIRGISFSGLKKFAERDSEVCYKCHADSVNRPAGSSNMKLLFDPNNQSYHPVERASKKRSISLAKELQRSLTINCTDCHESHGSDYPPLLKKNYTTAEGVESSYSYELCYSCHRRESILGNESFTGPQSKPFGHREHVVFVRTSCRTCHAAHGSLMNPSLIEFDRQIVTGAGQYVPGTKGSPTCILTCHGKNHGVTQPMQEPKLKKKK
ncbi:MAG TPA: cytochrome c3 family protein [Thermodesulfovibrionales bacterium]|nr:cytochrome c3 family protein [Thermodesulfovibrionales bacterium]